jgi:glyoxylase-like metal-dependent hydrolase (beta-lactamase superfamily II)
VDANAPKDRVPNWLAGTNPYLTEVAFKFKFPLEGVRGGAATLYPEFAVKLKSMSPPSAQSVLKPEYKDESTKIAERADAQPRRPPNYDAAAIEVLHVNRNVYMLAGAGANIAVSIGKDGVVMVDTGIAQMTAKVLAAVQKLTQQFVPPPASFSATGLASTWQIEHSTAPTVVRLIINTSLDAEHLGGNDKIVLSPFFHPMTSDLSNNSGTEMILAHENVLRRVQEMKSIPQHAMPSNTYFSDRYRIHRFVNGEGIEVFHLPNAHTDGDSMVWFRTSDVIATGEVFNSDTYPVIDVDKGGSIQGVIDGLIRITDMMYPEDMSQGGTMVIPGHGRICDVADVGLYRDMMIVIRDRVRDMIRRGMSLQQVKAAKPTMDYDPLFGREPGATAQFVEAVYRSLKEDKKAQASK